MNEHQGTGETTPKLDGAPNAAVNGLAHPTSPETGTNGVPATPTQGSSTPLSQAEVTALIERNYVGLRLLVSRRCRDPHVAADLLHEAVLTTLANGEGGEV